jgi:DNA replication protein DnaC
MTSVEVITNQLMELRLSGIRDTYQLSSKQTRGENLTNDDSPGLLLQDELEYRRGAKIKRLLRRALFRQTASLEDLDLKVDHGLDKRQLKELASCGFLDAGINILIVGPTGV